MKNEVVNPDESLATLVAKLIAARRAGDRELERETLRRLGEQFHVTLHVARDFGSRQGVGHE
jgi:hypothetical protein